MHSRKFLGFVLQKLETVALQSCRRSRQTIASIRNPEQLIGAQLVRKFTVMDGCDLKPAHLKSRQLFYKKKVALVLWKPADCVSRSVLTVMCFW